MTTTTITTLLITLLVCLTLLPPAAITTVVTSDVIGDEARRNKYESGELETTSDSAFDVDQAVRALKQASKRGKLHSIPLKALESLARRLGSLVPHYPGHFTGIHGPVRSTTDTKRQGRYALAMAPIPPCSELTATTSDLYARALCDGSLPSSADVWTQLFRRDKFIEEARVPLNFLMVTLVNWFHDDSFRTKHATNGSEQWLPKDSLTLSQVYGDSQEREAALRTFVGGKMKTSTAVDTGEILPPLLSDIQATHPTFKSWTPNYTPNKGNEGPMPGQFATGVANATIAKYYAFGDPRFNMHPGHLFWGSLALRLHNQFCDMVASERPHYNDQQVFERARLLTFHIVMKIRTVEFVSDAVSPFRKYARFPYEPDVLRTLSQFTSDWVHVFQEFRLLYHWHAFVPDDLVLSTGARIPFTSTLFNSSAAFNVAQTGIGELARSLRLTPIGQYGGRNTPHFFRVITERAIEDTRTQRMQSFNAYRRFFKMPPITSFDEFGMEAVATAAMRSLYGHPDKVGYFEGIMLETSSRITDNVVGDMQLLLVALFALQDLVSLDVIRQPEMWSEEYLTKTGKQYVEQFTLASLMTTLTGTQVACSFFHRDDCTPDTQVSHSRGRVWHLDNACDYVGIDWLMDWQWLITPRYAMQFLVALLVVLASGNWVFFVVNMATSPTTRQQAKREITAWKSNVAASAAQMKKRFSVIVSRVISVNNNNKESSMSKNPMFFRQPSPKKLQVTDERDDSIALMEMPHPPTSMDDSEEFDGELAHRQRNDTAASVTTTTATNVTAAMITGQQPQVRQRRQRRRRRTRLQEASVLFHDGTTTTQVATTATAPLPTSYSDSEVAANHQQQQQQQQQRPRKLHSFSTSLRRLGLDLPILTAVVTMNALYFTIMSGPVTYWYFAQLYSSSPDVEWEESYRPITYANGCFVTLYVVEGYVRTMVRRRLQLVFHHSATLFIASLVFITNSVFVWKVAIILVVAAYWEFPIYIITALERLQLLSARTLAVYMYPAVLLFYFGTRVVEIVLLSHLLSCSAHPMANVGEHGIYAALTIMSVFLVFMQLLLGVALYKMWRRALRKATATAAVEEDFKN